MEEHNRPTSEPGSSTARDAMNQSSRTFDETKEAMRQAYERSARSIGRTYDQAVEYSRHNPGKTALIAFGVGVGVGMLLLGSGRRSRVSRYGEPIVNALSNMAIEFIRAL